jgi:type IV pilus assembly protein PilB
MSDQQQRQIADHLVQHSLLESQNVDRVIKLAATSEHGIVATLVDRHQIPPQTLAHIVAHTYGLPLLDLDTITTGPTEIISSTVMRQYQLVPLWQRGHQLSIGIADPEHFTQSTDLQLQTGLSIRLVVVELDKLRQKLTPLHTDETSDTDALLDEALLRLTDELPIHPDQPTDNTQIDAAPLVRYVNQVLADAIRSGASDIHFEPYEDHYRIRFRSDGILYEKTAPPAAIATRLTARLKVMACLDVTERRLPQDGRIRVRNAPQSAVDFRVNTCPTLYGEKIVLRVLNTANTALQISGLGLEKPQQALLLQALQRPDGMILTTGPTGSGKTMSLYAILNQLNHPGVNISTVEDPVEIQLPGINQVNVNLKTGLGFATALRAFLRQDPDILMVGEMRDLETADIGIKAAQTGHLVLTTLHTNDVAHSLLRLTYLGIPAFHIAASIHLIMAQRLVRCLCPACKQVDKLSPTTLQNAGFTAEDIASDLSIYRAIGCPLCTDGYRGRTGIFEVVPISESLGRLMLEGTSSLHIRNQIRQEAHLSLHEAGLNKVRAGLTSLAEINRVVAIP